MLIERMKESAVRIDSDLAQLQAQAKSKNGFVSLVGAGPGDPELLTLKAFKLLKQADTLVYDRLVSQEILDLARIDANLINVGKESDNHTLPQNEITQLLIRLAREGRQVIRLKGGDPFIFGRGGEEIEGLIAAGIEFQVVPGITAASGCASYAGIPLTHRDHAQSVVFVTGHSDRYDLSDTAWREQWRRYVHVGQTVVIYMGVRNLARIRDELLSHGADRETPVAVIERGTTPLQKTRIGSLGQLPDCDAISPAIIIIGSVVKLRLPSVGT